MYCTIVMYIYSFDLLLYIYIYIYDAVNRTVNERIKGLAEKNPIMLKFFL